MSAKESHPCRNAQVVKLKQAKHSNREIAMLTGLSISIVGGILARHENRVIREGFAAAEKMDAQRRGVHR